MRFPRLSIALACSVPALSSFEFARSSPQSFFQTWSNTYGGAARERLLDMRQDSLASLRVAARTDSFGTGSNFGWLLSLSMGQGTVLQESTVGRGATGGVDGAGLAADGGAFFTGRDVIDLFHKHDAWAVRVDGAGGVRWTRGFTRPGFGRFFLSDAAEAGDGGVLLAGATSLIDEPPQRAWVVRLDHAGGLKWQYEYGGGGTEWIASAIVTPDGSVVAGWTDSSGAGVRDALVMKLNPGGDIRWQRTYGAAGFEEATEIVALSGGGYAVVGWTGSFTAPGRAPWVLRIDETGALLWHVVVGQTEWGDLDGVVETRGGGLVVLGRIQEAGHATNDLWAAKLALADGAVLWQRAYAGSLGDFASQLVALPGGLLLGGEWGSGFPEESLWLLRTDTEGRLADECDIVRETSLTTSHPNVLAAPGVLVRQTAVAQPKAVDFVHAPSKADVEERCQVE